MLTRLSVLLLMSYAAVASAQQNLTARGGDAYTRDGFLFRYVSPEELPQFLEKNKYVPVPTDELNELLRKGIGRRDILPPQSAVKRADYKATLINESLEEGRLVLELYSPTDAAVPVRPLPLGVLNLRDLRLSDENERLFTVVDETGSTVVLPERHPGLISGTWSASGTLVGEDLVFQLSLPSSSVCSLIVSTPLSMQVLSSNALVISLPSEGDMALWQLYPRNPAVVSITCTRSARLREAESPGIAVTAEYRTSEKSVDAVWSINVPRNLSDSEMVLKIKPVCQISKVEVGSGSTASWKAETGDSETVLHISIPAFSLSTAMMIYGKGPMGHDCEYSLPSLIPQSFTEPTANQPAELKLRSGTWKLTLPPETAISELNLIGLQERDVTVAADSGQVLELIQYTSPAAASICVTHTTPVVKDAVVIRVDAAERQSRAVAYTFVSVTTGALNEVGWDVPTSWRVTDVTETGSELPLLFQIDESPENPQSSQLKAFLRSPLTVGNRQLLTIQMESTESRVRSNDKPALLNSRRYQRTDDYLVTTAVDMPRFGGKRFQALQLSQLLAKLPWLPIAEAADLIVLSAAAIAEDTDRPATSDLFSTVDYRAEVDREFFREYLRVRLTTQEAAPDRVLLTIPSGIDLRMAEESATQPLPTLRRQHSGDDVDEWVVELPPGSSIGKFMDFTLICVRPVQNAMSAGLISFPNARQTGGTLSPPAADSGVQIVTGGDAAIAVTETIPYPPDTVAGRMSVRRNVVNESGQQISGHGLLLLSQTETGYSAELLYRLQVSSGGDQSRLRLQVPAEMQLSVMVNGRPAYANPLNDGYSIALPRDRDESDVDILVAPMDLSFIMKSGRINVPLLQFPGLDNTEITYAVMPPMGIQVDGPEDAVVNRHGADLLRLLLARHNASTDQNQNLDGVRQSLSRWQLRIAQSSEAVLLDIASEVSRLELFMTQSERNLTVMIILSVLTFVGCIHIRSVFRASLSLPTIFVLVVLTVLRSEILMGAGPVIDGLLLGTGAFGVLLVFRELVFLLGRKARSLFSIAGFRKALTNWGLLPLLIYSCQAQDFSYPAILVPRSSAGELPLVYVPERVYGSLSLPKPIRATNCFSVESSITLVVESANSCVATIECVVAVDPESTTHFGLPLSGVTLVDCSVDGNKEIPAVSETSQAIVTVRPRSSLRIPQLSSEGPPVAAAGPGTAGPWDLRTVRYEIRSALAVVSEFERRLNCPLPATPVTRLRVHDRTGEIASAGLREGDQFQSTSMMNGSCELSQVFNLHSLDLVIRLYDAEASRLSDRPASVFLEVDVATTQTRVAAEYYLATISAQHTPVAIRLPARRRIVGVESVTGDAVPWAVRGDLLLVRATPTEVGDCRFVVRLILETPISLNHQVPVSALAHVNGQRVSGLLLAASPGTSEQFVVSRISVADTDLPEADPSTLNRMIIDPERRRPSDRYALVPDSAETVEIAIAPRITTREAQLVQSVLVNDEEFAWSCRCQIEVRGQPVFRQLFRVSPELRLEQITASIGNTPLLNSWTTDGEDVIVSLREATRGVLVFEFQGKVDRPRDVSQTLPVFSPLGTVEILGSTLLLSAKAISNVLIHDLAGAIPDLPFDLARTPLSESSLRLTLTDENRPPQISPPQDSRLSVTAVVLLRNVGNQLRAAQVLAMNTGLQPFDIRFTIPAQGYDTQKVFAVRGGKILKVVQRDGELEIPRASIADGITETYLVLNDFPVVSRGGLLNVGLPDFHCESEFTSASGFDLRSPEADSEIQAQVPAWGRDALAACLPGLSVPESCIRLNAETDMNELQIRLVPVGENPKPIDTPSAAGVVSVQAIHKLHQYKDGSAHGSSAFLIFSSEGDGDVELFVPEDLGILDVQVDGLSRSYGVHEGAIPVSVKSRLSHVTIVWMTTVSKATRKKSAETKLPWIAGFTDSIYTYQPLSSGNPLRWISEFESPTADVWKDRLVSSVQGGLRRTETATPVSGGMTLPGNLPSVFPVSLWDQLAVYSPKAVASLAEFFSDWQLIEDSSPEITIHRSVPVFNSVTSLNRDSAASAAILLAILMTVVSMVTHRINQQTRKSSTAIAEPEAIPRIPSQARGVPLASADAEPANES